MSDIAFRGAFYAAFTGASGSSGGKVLTEWTPNLNGINSYGTFTAWSPTGADWEIRLTTYDVQKYSTDRVVIDSETSTGRSSIRKDRTSGEYNFLFWDANTDIKVNGVVTLHDDPSTGEEYQVWVIKPPRVSTVVVATLGAAYVLDFGHWFGQIQSILLIDNDDPSNSVTINAIINSEEMPTELEIFNELTGLKIGDFFNLGVDQPYVPVLMGGAIDRITYDALKSEHYNGSLSTGNFINGVNTTDSEITSLGTQVGSWLDGLGTAINVGDIIVAKNGAVIKVTGDDGVNTYTYAEILPNTLLLDDAGNQLTDDAGADLYAPGE